MQVEFELEPRDVEAWHLYHIERSRSHRLNYLVTGLIVAGVLAVRTNQLTESVVLSSVGAVVGFGLGWLLGRALMRSYVRFSARQYAGAAAATQFGKHQLTIDAAGIAEIGPASQHRNDWRAVEDIVQTSAHLFVIIAGGYAYIVPKRAFSTPDEVEAFRAAADKQRSQAQA
jgi:YcxB-like protein